MNQTDYLKFLFKQKNFKIKELAAEMGLSANSLSMKISGKVKWSNKNIDFLLKKLKMRYEDVFIGTNDINVSILQIGDTKYILKTSEIDKLMEDYKLWEKAI